MDPHKITDTFTVSPQISLEDVPAIAKAGFRTILCNRPDGEEPGQVSHAEIEAAAHKAGLEFRSVPIVSAAVSQTDLADFKAVLDAMPAPILAYCRSGTRCTMMWSIMQMGKMPGEKIVEAAAAAGYDMSGLVAQMSRQQG
ncbi:TIGR01244 family sulfur transferase [Rhodobacteraceae bacterium KMM 6894]|nr:TIGR01244 family sulfur transferase [Rhodobacteraceae bacterium KMM 6894]